MEDGRERGSCTKGAERAMGDDGAEDERERIVCMVRSGKSL